MKDNLSKNEIRKDALQDAVDATATTVGQVATILTNAVRDIANAVGGLATEVFEIRDAAVKAESDQEVGTTKVLDAEDPEDLTD
ncbi:MAG: hypothetical protein JWR35_112 [Marmoricola sp.]|nr:hypothetical protein [Marmoricola sp.]